MTSRANVYQEAPGERPAGAGSRSRVSPAAASEPVATFVIDVYPQDDQGRWITHLGFEVDDGAPSPPDLLEIVRALVLDLAVVPTEELN